MLKNFTCIVCPNGCSIQAVIENGKIVSVEGASCKQGIDYVTQEIIAPMRTLTSSISVKGGHLPLVSVRLDRPVPKDRLFDVMEVIRHTAVTAPVQIGDILISDILGLHSNVIATKNIRSLYSPTEK